MKKLLLLTLILGLALTGHSQKLRNLFKKTSNKIEDVTEVDSAGSLIESREYIITLADNFIDLPIGLNYKEKIDYSFNLIATTLQTANLTDIIITRVYVNALDGFSAFLFNDKDVNDLRNLPFVKSIEPVRRLSAITKVENVTSSQMVQTTPYGISRVGGPQPYPRGRKAFVIDTGIDEDHPDLNVNKNLSKSFVGGTSREGSNCGLLGIIFGCPNTPTEDYDDKQGHGTHVAGTIGAIDNTIGVVGVVPGAEVVAIKVLGDNGSGTTSGVIAGVDYVMEVGLPNDVANMSLGGGASTALDNAVINLGKKGIFVVMAAGNESRSATRSSPGRANGRNLYTISAMDSNDNWARYSNFGNPPVDYCAPGSRVLSTYPDGKYATLSGTSMAAPHAAGIILLKGEDFRTSGRVNGDPDKNRDYIIHY